MTHPIARLADLGQSVWYDYIRRDMLLDGSLDRMIEEDRLAGMTSNPTIFEQAVAGSTLYDEAVRAAPADDPETLFEAIAVEDVRLACDRFAPVFERTQGIDGFVSIEVPPDLAYDTEATVEAARRLHRKVDRPNVMIKIPATLEGLPAIESCIREGISVNVTLLFSIERYREVMEAWFRALEARKANGESLGDVASVASFFVSRVDTAVDRILDERGGDLLRYRSKLAIANARLAYREWKRIVRDSERFAALREAGARLQRPLWASTSTKDPSLPDVYYVEALIGPDTIDTMPPQTYEAYKDHGRPAVRIEDDLDQAEEAFAALAAAGIDFSEITARLEREGVEKFRRSYDALLAALAEKRRRVGSA